MRNIAVVLSGCGNKDGSEITEAISVLVLLSKAGAHVQCFAPDLEFTPVNHRQDSDKHNEQDSHKQPTDESEKRNTLNEAARISRGQIADLADLDESKFDALVFPGGFGAAIHLSSWAKDGAKCHVNEHVQKSIKAFYKSQKPIAAICIAPVLLAKVLGKEGVTLTVGDDPATATEVQKTGAQHVTCKVTDYVSDRDHKILSTPAYMYEARPHEVFEGISKMIQELIEMA